MPLDPPEEWGDWDDMRWYIAHRDVRILEKDGQWYAHLNSLCKMRDGKVMCPVRNAHIPHDGELYETWEDIEEHCRELGLLPSRDGNPLSLEPRPRPQDRTQRRN